ncbi:MAG: septum formation initiator family protein [Alphaproteobacteria bacterium]|jgi:cell division protein FtsB|uniref:Cell division protein FtsB n=1 Tax=Celeribacter baekdonensis TaxID=875171 RepID=A0A1G7G3U2_9RHOB|nr:septum formation initiator family protein [Celeribacter baekdonensis]MBU0643932.1 septum formation initiator family protein [Alphaproteobacteria bacterium]MBU1278332.1 septum formation initiator family protein [Alphaproteobacteria bacterium]MBU1573846.1 septum formation initiator family protein [Alphaproteobacteria bacterium]MBU1830313.1 septum formation initiator family protein [Alphaproteobacteria bacterium]MBU2079736.1 septum formation initiator family protein [Alphaproteobacteria bacter
MAHPRKRPSLAVLLYTGVIVTLGGYFTFASVQGEYGLFRRLQIEAELSELQTVSGQLDEELAVMRNKTMRLSDRYLDLDLLDEQARDILGYLRSDEIVIR